LALDSDTLRIWNEPPQPGRRFGFWKLGLVGLGAGAQLVTRETPYQVFTRMSTNSVRYM